MNEFVQDIRHAKIRKSDVSACMIEHEYMHKNGNKYFAIFAILKCGERAVLLFNDLSQAVKVFDEIG